MTKKTALHLATENGYVEIIKLLLSHKDVDVDIKDEICFNFSIIFNFLFLMIFII